MPLGEARRDADGALEAGARRGEVLARARDHSEAVQRLGEVRPELERVLERHLGALGVARLEPGKAARELLGGARVDGRASGAAREEGEGGDEEEGGAARCGMRALLALPVPHGHDPPRPRRRRPRRRVPRRGAALEPLDRSGIGPLRAGRRRGRTARRRRARRDGLARGRPRGGRARRLRGRAADGGPRAGPRGDRDRRAAPVALARPAAAAGRPRARVGARRDGGGAGRPARVRRGRRGWSGSRRGTCPRRRAAALRGVPGALSTELVLGLAAYF